MMKKTTTYAEIVGRVIAFRRHRAKLDQSELGSVAGICQSMVSKIERGISPHSCVTLRQMAGKLGTTAGGLLRDADRVAADMRFYGDTVLDAHPSSPLPARAAVSRQEIDAMVHTTLS